MNAQPLTAEQRALVEKWRGLAVRVTLDVYKHANVDAISEGYVGLCRAAQLFDPSRGFRFQTYAMYWVRAFVMHHWLDTFASWRMGCTNRERKVIFGRGRAARFLERIGAPVTNQSIAEHLGVSEETVDRIQQGMQPVIQIGHAKNDDDAAFEVRDPNDLEEQIADDDLEDERRSVLRENVFRLDDRERLIIRQRWIADNKTLSEIGARLGLSRERVRQIEAGAISKLRQWMRRAA